MKKTMIKRVASRHLDKQASKWKSSVHEWKYDWPMYYVDRLKRAVKLSYPEKVPHGEEIMAYEWHSDKTKITAKGHEKNNEIICETKFTVDNILWESFGGTSRQRKGETKGVMRLVYNTYYETANLHIRFGKKKFDKKFSKDEFGTSRIIPDAIEEFGKQLWQAKATKSVARKIYQEISYFLDYDRAVDRRGSKHKHLALKNSKQIEGWYKSNDWGGDDYEYSEVEQDEQETYAWEQFTQLDWYKNYRRYIKKLDFRFDSGAKHVSFVITLV
tara:strand:+ start:3037 stop:3852 length:816 start_codon:yes stop_codon:yes gene_type:complete